MIIYKRKRPDSKVEHNFFLESCLNMAKCGFLSSKYYDFCEIFARKKPLYISHWVFFGCHSAKIRPQKITHLCDIGELGGVGPLPLAWKQDFCRVLWWCHIPFLIT